MTLTHPPLTICGIWDATFQVFFFLLRVSEWREFVKDYNTYPREALRFLYHRDGCAAPRVQRAPCHPVTVCLWLCSDSSDLYNFKTLPYTTAHVPSIHTNTSDRLESWVSVCVNLNHLNPYKTVRQSMCYHWYLNSYIQKRLTTLNMWFSCVNSGWKRELHKHTDKLWPPSHNKSTSIIQSVVFWDLLPLVFFSSKEMTQLLCLICP